jgi:hypothetical protein
VELVVALARVVRWPCCLIKKVAAPETMSWIVPVTKHRFPTIADTLSRALYTNTYIYTLSL